MAVYELKNELLCVTIDSHGAELKSLKRIHDNQEYMWKGDPAFWGRTSPVLFPFVGGVNQKKYRVDGKEYAMNQHGFARDMEFTLISQAKEEIWFELHSNEETLQKYPYAFVLKLGYKLKGNSVEVCWQVDYVLTHDAPSRFLDFTSLAVGESNRLHLFLDKVLLKLTYEKWFFGCYHKDVALSTKSRCVFCDVIPMGERHAKR